MRRLISFFALSLTLVPPVFAQTTTAEPPAPPALPAIAPATGDPDMNRLFQNVTTLADQLKADLTDLETSIQSSRDSIEKGGQVLDTMLGSVTELNQSLAEDQPVWSELNALLDLWEQRRKTALEKSETNPEFSKIADEWSTRIKTARELRGQISTERANSLALIRAIEADRDIVLAYYELGQADKAIEGLQRVSQNLQALNANMQSIVETAGAVQRPIAN